MTQRQTLPAIWLMTDPRLGSDLPAIVAALPQGAGVIFRHYQLPAPERRALFDAVRRVCRGQRRILLLAGSPRQARAWGADGFHGREGRKLYRGQRHSAPAHHAVEIRAARRAGADWLLLSPVFATRSHPGAAVLGRVRFGLLRRGAGLPVYALGGMNAVRARGLKLFGIAGWAAIDSLSGA
jgi:thiamine-phosphate pyrophosphorylase